MTLPVAKDQEAFQILFGEPPPRDPWTVEEIWKDAPIPDLDNRGSRKIHLHYQGWLPLIVKYFQSVIETGVYEGHSSRAWLADAHPRFSLWSIDPEIPEEVKRGVRHRMPVDSTWYSLTQTSQVALPYVMEGAIFDGFLHDSDHEYETQHFEYEWAWEHLQPGGFLMSDDYTWGEGRAWEEFLSTHNLGYYTLGYMAIVRKP